MSSTPNMVNIDVPKELINLARQIDVSAYSEKEIQLKLEQLEALATKHIPIRSTPIAQTAVYDVYAGLIEIFNKYDYKKIGIIKMSAAKPIIKSWAYANLKLKK